MFGPANKGSGVAEAFHRLCEHAGIPVRTPANIGALCCGTPWKSKGLVDGYASMRDLVVTSLLEATENGRLPVICDASSCTEGLQMLLSDIVNAGHQFTVIDAVQFVAEQVLPHLAEFPRLPSIVVHPTCSSTHIGSNPALIAIAERVADRVTVPDDWGCCAFAGDRGMLHPEFTAAATSREAAEVVTAEHSAYASVNRTCELAMTRATGHAYVNILEVLDRAIGASPHAGRS
jgi:D-lactate dehydrogenase